MINCTYCTSEIKSDYRIELEWKDDRGGPLKAETLHQSCLGEWLSRYRGRWVRLLERYPPLV